MATYWTWRIDNINRDDITINDNDDPTLKELVLKNEHAAPLVKVSSLNAFKSRVRIPIFPIVNNEETNLLLDQVDWI